MDKVTSSPGMDKGHTASQGAFGSYPKGNIFGNTNVYIWECIWEHKCPSANDEVPALVVTAPGCAPCMKVSLRTE